MPDSSLVTRPLKSTTRLEAVVKEIGLDSRVDSQLGMNMLGCSSPFKFWDFFDQKIDVIAFLECFKCKAGL